MHLLEATISRIISSTRETISSKFVPSYLNNITRDKIKEETSAIARHLNDIEESEDRLITVWDGTYVYLNKSTNYRLLLFIMYILDVCTVTTTNRKWPH